MELPQFTGKNLDKWAEEFASILRLSGQVNAPVQIVLDLIEKCCNKVSLEDQIKQTLTRCSTFGAVLVA